MILVDANLLINAFWQEQRDHQRAYEWLIARLNGTARVGLPWMSLLAFLRIVTNRAFATRPASMDVALEQVRHWLSNPRAWIPEPTEAHFETFSRLLSIPGLRPNDTTDAYLAALAIDHGLVLCSADVGFARFPGLRWENPLAYTPTG